MLGVTPEEIAAEVGAGIEVYKRAVGHAPPVSIDLGEPLRHAADMGRQLGERDTVLRQIEAVLRDAEDPEPLTRVRAIMSEYVGERL